MSSIDATVSVSFTILSFVTAGVLTGVAYPEPILLGAGGLIVAAALFALSRKQIRTFV